MPAEHWCLEDRRRSTRCSARVSRPRRSRDRRSPFPHPPLRCSARVSRPLLSTSLGLIRSQPVLLELLSMRLHDPEDRSMLSFLFLGMGRLLFLGGRLSLSIAPE